MIGDLLEKKLKDHKGKTIIVVMDDGLAFEGRLIEHDESTLILEEVSQTSSKKIKWEDLPEKQDEKEKVGYLDWTDINLEKVFIRTEHILRIWPWERDLEDEAEKQGKRVKKAVYSKSENLPNKEPSTMHLR